LANKSKKVSKQEALEAGAYDIAQVKTTPIDLPYDEIIAAIKKGKAYVLRPELKRAVVLRGAKKLQEEFNVKVKVEKLTNSKQFVMLPQ